MSQDGCFFVCLVFLALLYDVCCSSMMLLMTRPHSFLRKILPNSAGHFAKFLGLPRQNRPNSVAHSGLLFVSKLSYILFRNFYYWRLSVCSVMLATYQKNISFFSFFESAVYQVALCLLHRPMILPYCNIGLAVIGSLVWIFSVIFRDQIAPSSRWSH